tara:strand:+ start:1264 stop:4446 length:3183 start_codon:yes stop_codon:yes gene_type:complete
MGSQQLKAQTRLEVSGKVLDTESEIGLPGVAVRVAGKTNGIVTDNEGEFRLQLDPGDYTLEFSFMGYGKTSVDIVVPVSAPLLIRMAPADLELGAVEILATGYQEIPKSRASGSFVQVDQELVERKVSSNILDRLEDVTSGLIFNRTGDSGRDPISIRGRSTLGRFNQPLIVIDNFPFDGSLEDINPNDVASITVLKDAAAASIWGAQAGNGVIVITTKSGRAQEPMRVSLMANTNWIEPTDPFLAPNLAVTDYIAVETQLFESGFYNSTLTNANRPVVTPVVETLFLEREGMISEQESQSRLAQFRGYDLRNDLKRYLYQPQLNQQYSLGISGGSKIHGYRVGLGYDRNREEIQGNSNQRFTLDLKNNFSLLKDKLTVDLGFYGTRATRSDAQLSPSDLVFSTTTAMYPYARLADEAGNPLEVYREYNSIFKREAEAEGLLDWAFRPLEEYGKSVAESARNDWRINLASKYKLSNALGISALYQYWENQGLNETVNIEDSYFARNLINLYTQADEEGNLSYVIPKGAVYDVRKSRSQSHSARVLLDYNEKLGEHVRVDGLLGAELKSLHAMNFSNRYYGYNPDLSAVQPVDYINPFPRYTNPRSTARVPYVDNVSELTDRFYSGFANASVTYRNRYLLTASVRRDASNLFGVQTNQRAVPLWSAGAGWTLSEEDFYSWDKLAFLKFRLSYGYNGNVDRSLTAFTTAQLISFNSFIPASYALIRNAPNADLRWERIRISNLGMDFESKGGRIAGSLELYNKEGLDLIGESPYAPSSGITTFRGNNASTRTMGYDLTLSTKNLQGAFAWSTTFLISGMKEEVTRYESEVSINNLINYSISGQGGTYFPIEGRPLFGVYSLEWAGLNPENGNPMGMLDGQPSEDYRELINSADLESVIYHGPARPTSFGAIRNDFACKGFSLSVNISYRFGYFFRRESVQYDPILQGRGGHSDYALRWKNPGDEQITQIPSMPSARNSFRDQFYRNSSLLVEKGDHIRLQDIRLGYQVGKSQAFLSGIRNAEVFLYANNLGMIWKATESGLDPDFGFSGPLRSIAAGLQFDF